MFRVIKYIINILFLLLLAISTYLLIVKPAYIIYAIDELSFQISNNNLVRFLIEILIIIYFVILLLSYVEKLFKKSKNVYIKGNNGKIEVNLKTIEDISKIFLEEQSIVKQAKVTVKKCFGGYVVNANIENYQTKELNNKLSEISKKLEEYIENMIGAKPKKVNLSVIKINAEHFIEEEIKEQNVNDEKIVNSEEEEVVSLD